MVLNDAARRRGPVTPYVSHATGGPYQYNLNVNPTAYSGAGAEDSDVLALQRLINDNADARTLAAAGLDHGVDFAKNNAQIAALQARLNLKNQLGSSIGRNKDLELAAESGLKSAANENMNAGVKKTRQNYNSRGLLYSGMREGGEDAIKNAAAGGLASDIANTRAEYGNLLNEQKQAYANVGLADQRDLVNQANETFEIATKNSIARQQAYQQLGQGLGYAAATVYGGQNQQSASTASMPNMSGGGLIMPELGTSARYNGWR
jgi:hypothetical protein